MIREERVSRIRTGDKKMEIRRGKELTQQICGRKLQKPVRGCRPYKEQQICRLYLVFTYIYSLLIEKEICDCRKV